MPASPPLDLALAAVDPYVHAYGLDRRYIARIVEVAVGAAGPQIAAAASSDAGTTWRAIILAAEARINYLVDQLTEAVSVSQPLHDQVANLQAEVVQATADAAHARALAGQLANILAAIEAEPYVGEEPGWRRLARSGLALR